MVTSPAALSLRVAGVTELLSLSNMSDARSQMFPACLERVFSADSPHSGNDPLTPTCTSRLAPQHPYGCEQSRIRKGNDERKAQPQDLQIPPDVLTRFKGSSQKYLELGPHQQGRGHCSRLAQA
jgi:hypothetical protein